MASQLDRDDYVYDVDNLSVLMATLDADGIEPCARARKSKRLAAKMVRKSTKTQPPPASSIESLLELEKKKNENLKMELEITRAQLDLAKIKSISANRRHQLQDSHVSYRSLPPPPLVAPSHQASLR